MKRFIRAFAASLLGIALFTGTASAQTTITNGNGTGSTNTITNNSSFTCSSSNSNDIDVTVDNDQDANTGDATANGNTTVGNVSTGSASNSSTINTAITASNTSGCLPVALIAPPAPVVPHSPVGGSGGGQVATRAGVNTLGRATGGMGGGVTLADGTTITALPATGEAAPAEFMASVIAVTSGLAMFAKFGNNFRRELAL